MKNFQKKKKKNLNQFKNRNLKFCGIYFFSTKWNVANTRWHDFNLKSSCLSESPFPHSGPSCSLPEWLQKFDSYRLFESRWLLAWHPPSHSHSPVQSGSSLREHAQIVLQLSGSVFSAHKCRIRGRALCCCFSLRATHNIYSVEAHMLI